MAVIKHIALKNSNYSATVDYLTTKHDEFTSKPILDEKGRRIPREEYLIDGINCDPNTFHQQCQSTNTFFGKNQTREEIKAHHYILSFDPRDRDENGLTAEQAQQLGLAFAEKNFPGHQTIVCTHPDGHNSAGNIHVHIVINSVRAFDVEHRDFMERPADQLAGMKHHITKNYLEYLKQETMALCQREGLYQVDLLSPAKVRITDREYWAQRKGQAALDRKNAELEAIGEKPAQTKFETEKGYLRRVITSVREDSHSFDEFQRKLFELYGISVHESRGQISFLLPDRGKPIRGKSLGTDFERAAIEKTFLKTASISPDKNASALHGGKRIRLVVQIDMDIKAMQNPNYALKVKLSNLDKLVASHNFMVENGMREIEDVEALLTSVSSDTAEKHAALKATQERLKTVNALIRYSGQYYTNKKVYTAFLKAKNKVKFREEHQAELLLYEAARKNLNELCNGAPIPSMKDLKAEKAELTVKNNAQYEDYSFARAKLYELQAIHQNLLTYMRERQIERAPEQDQVRS